MKIKDLLAKPEAWTQDAEAGDIFGQSVSPDSDKAVCWCLRGAAIKCYGFGGTPKIMAKICKEIGVSTPCNWNDQEHRTHAEVLALVTKLDI